MDLHFIEENLKEVEENICAACAKSGRSRDEVTLIAVSKTKPAAMIEKCVENGIKNFGENKAQELTDKLEQISDSNKLSWNFIGHLQTNKVKYIVGNVSMIHSVDSFKLAKAINDQAEKKDLVCNILIEVNAAGEESKFGVSPEETENLIREIAVLKNIKICGLMTIAPYVVDPEENRIYFAQLKQLLVDINAKNIDNVSMNVLSMGMTGDYQVAIEEGATMVRVGTGIFGERDYSKA